MENKLVEKMPFMIHMEGGFQPGTYRLMCYLSSEPMQPIPAIFNDYGRAFRAGEKIAQALGAAFEGRIG